MSIIRVSLALPSLLWLLVKLSIYLLKSLPTAAYTAWVVVSTFSIYAGYDNRVPAECERRLPTRGVRIVLCVAMSVAVEVPVYIVALKVLIANAARSTGVFGSLFGGLVLAVDLASIAVLLVLFNEGFHAAEDMRHQLQDVTWSEDPTFETRNLVLKSLSPMFIESTPRDLYRYYAISYLGPDDLRRNSVQRLVICDEGLLDVYSLGWLPNANRPVVVYVHGGGWDAGDKNHNHTMPKILAEKGMVVVSANYRLADRFPQPAGIHDVKKVLLWTRACIASFGGDPSYIVLAGDSAGGHLAQLAALTPEVAELFDGDATPQDLAVKGTILIAPALDVRNHFGIRGYGRRAEWFAKTVCGNDAAVAKLIDPIQHLSKATVAKMPPALIFHGTFDTIVSPLESAGFRQRCIDLGGSPDLVRIVEVLGMHHASHMFHSVRTITMGHLAADWALEKWSKATGGLVEDNDKLEPQ
ncbi:hypothetical protein PYCC9005_005111 [Savitreella phatthalungensis]